MGKGRSVFGEVRSAFLGRCDRLFFGKCDRGFGESRSAFLGRVDH